MVIFLTNLTFIFIFLIPLEGAPPVVVVEGTPTVAEVVVATAVLATVLVVAAATTTAAGVVVVAVGVVVVAAVAVATAIAAAAAKSASAAATTLVRVSVALGGTPAASGSSISRRFEGARPCAMKHLDTLVEVSNHAEEVIHGQGLSADVKSRNQGLVVHIQPRNDEGDKLLVGDGFSSGG